MRRVLTQFIFAEPLYECRKCSRRYRAKRSLRRHMKYECKKEPSLKCPYCPHMTKHRCNLNIHIRVKHQDQLTV